MTDACSQHSQAGGGHMLAPYNLVQHPPFIEKPRSPDPQSTLSLHSDLQKHSYMKEEPWSFKIQGKGTPKEGENLRQKEIHTEDNYAENTRAYFGCEREVITEGQTRCAKKLFFFFLFKERNVWNTCSKQKSYKFQLQNNSWSANHNLYKYITRSTTQANRGRGRMTA